ncbi:MAG: hypothetical protein QM784_26185 [Polyangiaceae bacterium]
MPLAGHLARAKLAESGFFCQQSALGVPQFLGGAAEVVGRLFGVLDWGLCPSVWLSRIYSGTCALWAALARRELSPSRRPLEDDAEQAARVRYSGPAVRVRHSAPARGQNRCGRAVFPFPRAE